MLKTILCASALMLSCSSFAAGQLNSVTLHPETAPYPTITYTGWACEPDAPNFQGYVEFWTEQAIFLGAASANVQNADVARLCGGNSAHGFSSTSYLDKSRMDGQEHQVHAYFVRPDGSKVKLSSLPIKVRFSKEPPACPASNDHTSSGIGDGCTTKGAENAVPNIAYYREAFTPACNNHDKCYTTLGTTYAQCNDKFYADMERACEGTSNAFSRKFCRETARQYHQAVVMYANSNDPLPGLQLAALKRSRNLEQQLLKGECQTTPQASTLFSDSLISKIQYEFFAHTRQLPTTKQFFYLINQGGNDWGNVVTNYAGWEMRLSDWISNFP